MSATDKFFVRLNLDFSKFDINTEDLSWLHGYNHAPSDEKYSSLNYFALDDNLKQQIKAILPVELQEMIRNIRIAIIKGQIIMPHRDHGGSVSVNYHLVTGDARTTFWTANRNAKPFKVDNKQTDNVYDYPDVVEECFYVAEKNSCYLLNTGEIHDVVMESKDSVRKILQFTFDSSVSYQTVLEKMTMLNLVKDKS